MQIYIDILNAESNTFRGIGKLNLGCWSLLKVAGEIDEPVCKIFEIVRDATRMQGDRHLGLALIPTAAR